MMSTSIVKRVLDLTRKTKPESAISLAYLNTVASPPPDLSNPTMDPLIADAVSILSHHRSKSRWSTLRSLFPTGFTTAQFSEITLCIRNNPHLALRFFLFTRRHSLCPHDLLSFSTLIHVLARSRLRGHAREITRLAIRLAGESDGGLRGTVNSPGEIEVECLLKVFRSLVKTYNRCGSAPFVFDLLIKSCLDSKKVDGAVLIMRKLRSRSINPQISTCNALISEVSRRRGAYHGYELYKEVFGSDDEVEKAVKWVGKVRPNAHTFNSMLVSFYREGEMEMVEEIWSEMEEVGCSPNSYSYSILMAVYCERSMMSKAENKWEEMKLKGLEHDVVAYNTMIGGFCNNGVVARAEALFQEMGLKGIEGTCVTYEHLVNGHCKVGDLDSALLVYKDMRRKSFQPDGSIVEAFVEGLCDKQRVVEAMETMKVAMRDFGFSPSGKCYESLIKGLCEQGKLHEASKIQADMVGRGFKPNREIYSAFIHGHMKEGDKEMAALLRKEMDESLKAIEKEEDQV